MPALATEETAFETAERLFGVPVPVEPESLAPAQPTVEVEAVEPPPLSPRAKRMAGAAKKLMRKAGIDIPKPPKPVAPPQPKVDPAPALQAEPQEETAVETANRLFPVGQQAEAEESAFQTAERLFPGGEAPVPEETAFETAERLFGGGAPAPTPPAPGIGDPQLPAENAPAILRPLIRGANAVAPLLDRIGQSITRPRPSQDPNAQVSFAQREPPPVDDVELFRREAEHDAAQGQLTDLGLRQKAEIRAKEAEDARRQVIYGELKARPQRGATAEIGSALASGAAGTAASVLGGVGEALTIPGAAFLRKFYESLQREPALAPPPQFEYGTTGQNILDPRWWTRITAENIPNFVAMWAPGAAVGHYARAAGWSARGVKGATRGATLLSAAAIEGGSAFGSAYDEMIKAGFSEAEARAIAQKEALYIGITNGLLEILTPDPAMKALALKKGVGSRFMQVLRNSSKKGLLESGTEVGQEINSILAEEGFHDQKHDAEEVLRRLVTAGAAALPIGSGFGAVEAIGSSVTGSGVIPSPEEAAQGALQGLQAAGADAFVNGQPNPNVFTPLLTEFGQDAVVSAVGQLRAAPVPEVQAATPEQQEAAELAQEQELLTQRIREAISPSQESRAPLPDRGTAPVFEPGALAGRTAPAPTAATLRTLQDTELREALDGAKQRLFDARTESGRAAAGAEIDALFEQMQRPEVQEIVKARRELTDAERAAQDLGEAGQEIEAEQEAEGRLRVRDIAEGRGRAPAETSEVAPVEPFRAFVESKGIAWPLAPDDPRGPGLRDEFQAAQAGEAVPEAVAPEPPAVAPEAPPVTERVAEPAPGAKVRATKLRSLADRMQSQIDEKRRPSTQNVTARRARIKNAQLADADVLEKTQQALRGLADLRDSGPVPVSLSGITNRAQVEDILLARYPEANARGNNVAKLLGAIKGRKGTAGLARRLKMSSGYNVLRGDQVDALDKALAIAKKAGKAVSPFGIDIASTKRLRNAGIANAVDWQKAKTALEAMLTGPSAADIQQRKIRESAAEAPEGPEIVPNSRDLDIRNLDALPRGTGAQFLEVVRGQGDELIAKQWRRKIPTKPNARAILVDLREAPKPEKAEREFLTTPQARRLLTKIGLTKTNMAAVLRKARQTEGAVVGRGTAQTFDQAVLRQLGIDAKQEQLAKRPTRPSQNIASKQWWSRHLARVGRLKPSGEWQDLLEVFTDFDGIRHRAKKGKVGFNQPFNLKGGGLQWDEFLDSLFGNVPLSVVGGKDSAKDFANVKKLMDLIFVKNDLPAARQMLGETPGVPAAHKDEARDAAEEADAERSRELEKTVRGKVARGEPLEGADEVLMAKAAKIETPVTGDLFANDPSMLAQQEGGGNVAFQEGTTVRLKNGRVETLQADVMFGDRKFVTIAEEIQGNLLGPETRAAAALPAGVLKRDEHGNNVTFEDGENRITINTPGAASFIALWARKAGRWVKVGALRTDRDTAVVRGERGEYLRVSSVQIDRPQRGRRFGTRLYRTLLDQAAPEIQGIISYLPDRSNRLAIPRIYQKLGAFVEGDFEIIPRTGTRATAAPQGQPPTTRGLYVRARKNERSFAKMRDVPYATIPVSEARLVAPLTTTKQTLDAVLHLPGLYERFPSLRSYDVRLSDQELGESVDGYVGEAGVIYINVQLPKSRQLGAVVHETQHAIQELEGDLPKHLLAGDISGQVDYLSDPREVAARDAQEAVGSDSGEPAWLMPEWQVVWKERGDPIVPTKQPGDIVIDVGPATDKAMELQVSESGDEIKSIVQSVLAPEGLHVDSISLTRHKRFSPATPLPDKIGALSDWHMLRAMKQLTQFDPKPVESTVIGVEVLLKTGENGIVAEDALQKQGYTATSSAPSRVTIALGETKAIEGQEAWQVNAKGQALIAQAQRDRLAPPDQIHAEAAPPSRPAITTSPEDFAATVNRIAKRIAGPRVSDISITITDELGVLSESEAARFPVAAGIIAGGPKNADFNPLTGELRLFRGANLQSAFHELAGHWAYTSGLLTPQEQAAIDTAYPNEENFSTAVAEYALNRARPTGIVGRALQRVTGFLRRLARGLGLRGMAANDVFEDILSGRVGQRPEPALPPVEFARAGVGPEGVTRAEAAPKDEFARFMEAYERDFQPKGEQAPAKLDGNEYSRRSRATSAEEQDADVLSAFAAPPTDIPPPKRLVTGDAAQRAPLIQRGYIAGRRDTKHFSRPRRRLEASQAGRDGTELVDKIVTEHQTVAGRNLRRMERVSEKLTLLDKHWMVKNFKDAYEAGEEMPTPRIQRWADAWTETHNDIGKLSEDLGVLISDPRAKGGKRPFKRRIEFYFPRVWTQQARDALQEKRGELYDAIVAETKRVGIDLPALLSASEINHTERHFKALERPRIGEVPTKITMKGRQSLTAKGLAKVGAIKPDREVRILADNPFEVANRYIEDSARRLAIIKHMGQDTAEEKAAEISLAILDQDGSEQKAVWDAVWADLQGRSSDQLAREFPKLAAAEALIRFAQLSTSTLSNMGGFTPIAVRLGTRNTARAFVLATNASIRHRLNLVTRGVLKDAKTFERLEALSDIGGHLRNTLGHTAFTEDLSGIAGAVSKAGLRAVGFEAINRHINKVGNLAASDALTEGIMFLRHPKSGVLRRLWGRDAQGVRNMLIRDLNQTDEMIDDAMANGITDEMRARAIQAARQKTNITGESPMDRPSWMNGGIARRILSYMSYVRSQGNQFMDALWHARRGNLAPLSRTIFLYAPVGLGMLALKDAVFNRGDDDDDDTFFAKLFGAYMEMGTFGLLGSFGEDAYYIHKFKSRSFVSAPQMDAMTRLTVGFMDSLLALKDKEPGEAGLIAYKTVINNVMVLKALDAQLEGPVWQAKNKKPSGKSSKPRFKKRKRQRK